MHSKICKRNVEASCMKKKKTSLSSSPPPSSLWPVHHHRLCNRCKNGRNQVSAQLIFSSPTLSCSSSDKCVYSHQQGGKWNRAASIVSTILGIKSIKVNSNIQIILKSIFLSSIDPQIVPTWLSLRFWQSRPEHSLATSILLSALIIGSLFRWEIIKGK